MAEILAASPAETITLITCAGTFQGGYYTDRLVVRALRTKSGQNPQENRDPLYLSTQ